MLHLTVADRLEPLARRLAAVLRADPTDPMEPEWIATPGGGVRTWLWLELARHVGAGERGLGDGVAANITAAFPGTLRTAVLDAARGGDEDPWVVTRLAWTVLAVLLDHHAGRSDAVQDPLVDRFGEELPEYGRARRIADLFDRYHLHRPDLVLRWAGGEDVDVLGQPLAPHQRWQPVLWRRVRERIGEPGPPERLPEALARLRAGTLDLDLPRRLSVFGMPALPGGAGFIDLAAAVAEHRDVHLFLLDPSPVTSAAVRARVLERPPTGPRRRADDPGADLVAHPLLRSWARLPRETAVLLADAEAVGFPAPEILTDAGSDTGSDGETLLRRIQADIGSGRTPDGSFRRRSDDRSLEFHTAHGRVRQVDIARDVILHALAEDPTLTEEDILVICPALDAFEPLVRAGFGPSASDGSSPDHTTNDTETAAAPRLRHRVADRSIGRDNPVVTGLDAILEIVPGRLDAIVVQDLLAEPAVRARHRLTDEDLARISDWVAEGDVRWGLDPDHRADFGVPTSLTTNSWGDAVDRLLLGSTLPEDDLAVTVGGIAPIGIEGEDVELAARLAEILARLREIGGAARGRATLPEWLCTVRRAVDGLLAATEDERDIEAVRRILTEIDEESESAPGSREVPLGFGDVRRLLRERLASAPAAPPFFRGGITITSPDSLRGVPHRLIVMLGMDQAAFGIPAGDGDDLAAALPLLGDREPRAGRRQAILDAVIAAQDRLVVIRDGADLRTNQEIPPAVIVSELHDLVLATLADPPTVEDLEIRHPRQPFDDRCFVTGHIREGTPWSFDPGARAAAIARRRRRTVAAPFLEAPLPVRPSAAEGPFGGETIDLDDLIRAVTDPPVHFLRHRLQIRLPDEEEPPSIQLPTELVQLERWAVGDALIRAIERGQDPDEWMRSARRRGLLPPGALGDESEADVRDTVRKLLEAIERIDAGLRPLRLLPVDLHLPDGTRVTGTVQDHHGGDRLGEPSGPVQINFGRMKPSHRLRAWLQLMALTAGDPAGRWQSSVLGSDKKKHQADLVCLRPIGDESRRHDLAIRSLERAVDIARRGHREPLPIFPTLSAEIHRTSVEGKKLRSDSWRHQLGWGDGDRAEVQLVFGDIDLDELRAIETRPEDPFDEPSRVDGWARHLWELHDESVADHAAALLADETGGAA